MWYVVLILVILILILERFINDDLIEKNIKEEIDYSEKYIKKDYLLTQTELKFYKILKSIADELNLIICPQVPLYQVVRNIEYKDFSRISNKTIDFLITEQNLKIRICVELDDYTHKQQKRIKRDNFVNELLEKTGVKILRIPVQSYYEKDDLRNKIKELLG